MAGVSRAAAAYLIVTFVVASCWRGNASEPAEPVSEAPEVKGASCEQCAQNAHDVIAKAQDEQLAARAAPLQAIVLRRCKTDGWSMELRRCVAGATTVDDATTCDKLATKPQRDAFAHDVEVMVVED